MSSVLLDTNVLLLYLMGNRFPGKIGTKRLSAYDLGDLRTVNAFCDKATEHITLPNILTEVSNFLVSDHHPDAWGAELLRLYCELVAEEIYLPSKEVVEDPVFQKIGLTDAGIYRLQRNGTKIMTDDYNLYNRLMKNGVDAVNILHSKGLQ